MTTNGNGQQQHHQQPQQQTAISPITTSSEALALVPSSIDGAFQLARWLSHSRLLPEKLVGKEADIFTMVLAGMELGLPPLAALRGMYIVNGKPALESKTKAAICLQRGAALYFKRIEYTPEATTWETLRHGQTEPVRMRYTRNEAKDAGLLGKAGPWREFPQRMISHRALGWICDDVYPDVVLGVATAEDFEPEELTFKPIGAGVAIADAPVIVVPSAPPPSAPATAKPANPPSDPAPQNGNGKTAKPAPMSADRKAEIKKLIAEAGTVEALQDISRKHINTANMDGAARDELAHAYGEQLAKIRKAIADERAAAETEKQP